LGGKNPGGETILVGYVVPSHAPGPSASDLRSYLSRRLPAPFLPSAFVFLDGLPLLPNGKVDRNVLLAQDHNRLEQGRRLVAPRTALEQRLAQIWTEVLKLERIGVHDNFFDLGGHSLIATQVVSRIRDACQTNIPLRTLFEKPTVEELAVAIMHGKGEQMSEKELSGMLDDLESLSEDEVKQRLVWFEKDRV